MNRHDLLARCQSEAERMGQTGLAIGAIASILRRDTTEKSAQGHDAGMTLFELDGLAVALALVADKLWLEADQLDDMARKHLPARSQEE